VLGAGQVLYGAPGGLAGLRPLDPQVAQQPVERLLVGVVVLALGEVAGPAILWLWLDFLVHGHGHEPLLSSPVPTAIVRQ